MILLIHFQKIDHQVYRYMQQQKYGLLLASSLSAEEQLGKLISYLFSNDHLFINHDFRKLVEKDRKGYISLHQLLKNESIQQYFRELSFQDQASKFIYLKSTIKIFCRHLHYHDQRVRRIDLWQKNMMRDYKPIGVTDIKVNLTISDIRDYFGESSFTPRSKIIPSQTDIILIYSQNGSQSLQKFDRDPVPFEPLNYYQLCQEKSRNSRFWQTAYQKNYLPVKYERPNIKFNNYHPPSKQFSKYIDKSDFSDISDKEEQLNLQNQRDFLELVLYPKPDFNCLLQNFLRNDLSRQSPFDFP